MSQTNGQDIEKLYKVIIIGDPAVGKTSFVQRYTRNMYPTNYKMTVGVDFMVKVIKKEGGLTLKLQLWDIAGQERFSQVTRVYYKNANACVIMFDITNRESFASVARWKKDLDTKCFMSDGNPIPCVLLGNKCDLSRERAVSVEEAETLCRDLMFVGWNETSGKERIHVDQSMEFLLEEMLKREAFIMALDQQGGVENQPTTNREIRLKKASLCDDPPFGCTRC